MLKRTLLTLVVAFVCSTAQGVFAQDDIFLSFGGLGSGATQTTATTTPGTTGSAFLFARNGFDFDGFQVAISSSDSAVAQITGATVINSDFSAFISGTRFNNSDVDTNSNGVLDGNETGDINAIPGILGGNAGGDITLQATSINQTGISTAVSTVDNGFDTDQGFLIAQIDYSVLAGGTADFSIATTADDVFAGPTGFLTIPEGVSLSPVFGSPITLTVDGGDPPVVPEPTSAALLALGFAGLFTRRRR